MKNLTLKRLAKFAWKIVYGIFAIIGLLTVAAIIILKIYILKTGQSAYFCTGPYPSITFPKVAFGISLSPYPSVALRLNSDKLRASGKYANDTIRLDMKTVPDTARAREIQEYFQLDTLYDANASTWDKTLAVAKFVASNIPHAPYPTVWPERLNAISLWEYTKNVEPAFNCRLHSIMMYELLQSIGIEARFITCSPEDSNDSDFHVMNHVWLPELGKWAMIDSDSGGNYATDEDGTPLSLPEIRQRYIADEPVCYHPKFDEKGSEKISSHHAYMAKNSYWYSCWETLHYDQEPSAGKDVGRYIHLVPSGFKPFGVDSIDVITTDSAKFWAPPIVE